MYKKVCFATKEDEPDRYEIVETVLTKGYALNGVFDCETVDDEAYISFSVNRCDLNDLRHDMYVLTKAGLVVREVEVD